MTGSCCAVAAAFTEPEKYRGTVIPVYDEVLTPKQMVDTFTQVTGIKARCETWLRLVTEVGNTAFVGLATTMRGRDNPKTDRVPFPGAQYLHSSVSDPGIMSHRTWAQRC